MILILKCVIKIIVLNIFQKILTVACYLKVINKRSLNNVSFKIIVKDVIYWKNIELQNDRSRLHGKQKTL